MMRIETRRGVVKHNYPEESLPFVDHSKGRLNYWNVPRTGDHQTDYNIGVCYAMEFISLSKEMELDPTMMELIINHMPNELGGVEKGFLNSLGWYVIHSVIPIGSDFKAKLDTASEIHKAGN